MGLYVTSNLGSLAAQRGLSSTTRSLNRTIERLSTGYRINRAADDAAGLQISEKLSAQIRSLEQASRNISDGNSLLSVADGAMSSISNDLQRMRELAIQASSDTLGSDERTAIQTEIDALSENITQTAAGTTFNDINLLDGSTSSLNIQVGPNNTANDRVDIGSALVSVGAGGLGVDSLSVGSSGDAQLRWIPLTRH